MHMLERLEERETRLPSFCRFNSASCLSRTAPSPARPISTVGIAVVNRAMASEHT